jgi:hypothetical protein
MLTPEGVQLGAERLQSLESHPVQTPGAIDSYLHQSCLSENTQVLAGGGLRHPGQRGQLPGLQLTLHDQLEHLPTARM